MFHTPSRRAFTLIEMLACPGVAGGEKGRSQSRSGFTLIEMLVVIAIIALLSSILVPVVSESLPDAAVLAATDVLYVALVATIGWLLIRLGTVLQVVVATRFSFETEDNLGARKVRTQVEVLKRVLTTVIVLVTLSAILLHFEPFRELGTGLLASAGVAGIVIGFAAQRTLGNLLAGFQIAISQPIRVDDVVVVEGEWGKIEEITLTYVVVRIWDSRRLVLPISYFIEKPFQNWTRSSADLLGTAFVYVDYTVPVEAVRSELLRLLKDSTYWDGRVARLQVTDLTEQTVELRALMSAAHSGDAFELRCEVREKLVAFIQREFPDALPVVRVRPSNGRSGENEDGSDVELEELYATS